MAKDGNGVLIGRDQLLICWGSENEIKLEVRIPLAFENCIKMTTSSTRLVFNSICIRKIERKRFVRVPRAVLPSMFELDLICRANNDLFFKGHCNFALRDLFADWTPH